MLGMVALISKSSRPVKPRSGRRTPRYSPVGMRSCVLMSLRVVVKLRTPEPGLEPQIGIAPRQSRRRFPGSRWVRPMPRPSASQDRPRHRASEIKMERARSDDGGGLDGTDVSHRARFGIGELERQPCGRQCVIDWF